QRSGVPESFLLPRVSPRAIVNSSSIFKSIGSMDSLQILRMNVEAVQCKRRSAPYSRQSADMTARKLSLRNLGLYDVPGLKSAEHRLPCPMRFWKAVLIGSAHLA